MGKGKGKAKGKDDGPPLEAVFGEMSASPNFQERYASCLERMTAKEKTVAMLRSLLPFEKAKVKKNPAGTTAMRAGILNGFKDFAEKWGIAWREDAKALQGALGPGGVEEWERMRLEVESAEVAASTPDYYVLGGVGTLHSYAAGNCNWEAAFDAPSAYLLVHAHHYPNLTPQEGFDALHRELDELALKHLDVGSADGAGVACADLGCGVGTSTFSTRRSLDARGLQCASLLGVELSSYFVAVAKYRQSRMGIDDCDGPRCRFVHGNALNLAQLGVADSSLDLVLISEVTHEMPGHVSQALFREVYRVLKPGGVCGYMDLNQEQIMRDNPLIALVTRVAMANEPYFDEYLEFDLEEAVASAGLKTVEASWPHKEKYEAAENCSLRFLVAKKS